MSAILPFHLSPKPSISTQKISCDILFIPFESLDVLSVKDALRQWMKKKMRVVVLELGDVHRTLHLKHVRCVSLKELGISGEIPRLRWTRDLGFDPNVTRHMANQIQADRVITGITCKAQAELSGALQKRGSQLTAFYLGLSLLTPLMRQNITTIQPHRLILTHRDLCAGKNLRLQKSCEIIEAGYVFSNNTHTSRKPQKGKPYLFFIGGYGENYNAVFHMFLTAVRELGLPVKVRLHPRVASGKIERRLAREAAFKNITFTSRRPSLKNLIAGAAAVVTHTSTAALDAYLAGKPVFYLDVPQTKFCNLPLQKRWIRRLTRARDLTRTLRQVLRPSGRKSLPTAIRLLQTRANSQKLLFS